MSMIEYRLAWARNGLKLVGVLENSARGVWTVTELGNSYTTSSEVVSAVKQWRSEYNKAYLARKRAEEQSEGAPDDDLDERIDETLEPSWQDQLLDRLKIGRAHV